jgi:hypothetical protein
MSFCKGDLAWTFNQSCCRGQYHPEIDHYLGLVEENFKIQKKQDT